MCKSEAWYNQDYLWETVETILFNKKRLSNTSIEVENIINLLEIGEGIKILDICCGIGRHALEFSRRGFNVIGIDRTQKYLDKAVKQANAEGLNIDFINSDMRNYRRPNTYDVVVNIFTSFGYFEDPNDDRIVVENVYDSLKSGGKFLLDMQGKEVLAKKFQEKDWYEEQGTLILEERKISQNWGWVENRWIMITNNQRIEHIISLRIYSAIEITTLLTRCGFSSFKVYGDLKGSNYDHTAKRLVVIAYK